MNKLQWHHETRKLSELREYDRNPRQILEKGFKDLQQSLDEFGLAEPLCIQPDGLIIGGHARYKALLAAGEMEADCMVPDRPLTHEEMKRLNLRLNKNTAGIFDMDMLAADFEIPELNKIGFEKKDFGFDIDFAPNLNPDSSLIHTTEEDIDHTGQDLNARFQKTKDNIEVICPKCGQEFKFSGN